MKQKIWVEQGLLAKNKPNSKRIQKLMSACLNLYDYKILCHLLAEMSYECDSDDFNIEAFVHRIGKVNDIKFEEINEKGTHANVTM